MVDSVLFQSQSDVGSTNISVFTNKNSRIFVALHCDQRRQGGLNAYFNAQLSDPLAKDNWALGKDWFIKFDGDYFPYDWGNIRPRKDDRSIKPCNTLNKVWSKHLGAGQTVNFPAIQSYMEFAIAIFVKESKDRKLKLFMVSLPICIMSV